MLLGLGKYHSIPINPHFCLLHSHYFHCFKTSPAVPPRRCRSWPSALEKRLVQSKAQPTPWCAPCSTGEKLVPFTREKRGWCNDKPKILIFTFYENVKCIHVFLHGSTKWHSFFGVKMGPRNPSWFNTKMVGHDDWMICDGTILVNTQVAHTNKHSHSSWHCKYLNNVHIYI